MGTGKYYGYRNLIVWQKAILLVERVYALIECFPQTERFRLSGQLSRAVVSIPSNIAEGCGRVGPKDYARFLSVARGSLYEVDTQLEIASRLNYCQIPGEVVGLISEITRMLNAMIARRSPPLRQQGSN